jgi:hypothetical protein
MQKARRHKAEAPLRPLVSVWFQVLFTPFLRVLFTFPLQYWFTIGLSVVFSLTRWCWHIQTEFLRFRLTHVSAYITFLYGIITLFDRIFQYRSNPLYMPFGLHRFRSPLLTV